MSVRTALAAACTIAALSGALYAQQAKPAAKPAAPAKPAAAAPAMNTKPADPAAAQVSSGEGFKNVQALKDVPLADFLPLMGLMTNSVGGDCATCHTNAGTDFVAWEADTPMKKKAREMSFMVRAINKQHFGGRTVITCWTCHRGRSNPVQTPTMDQIYGGLEFLPAEVSFTNAPGQPKAEAVLDKYIQAIGGAAKVDAINTWEGTGDSIGFRGFGGGGKVKLYARRPDQRSMVITYEAKGRDATVRNFDGKIGWTKTPINVIGEHLLAGAELDGIKLDAQMMFPTQIKTALKRLRTIDPQDIDDKAMVVVQGNGPGSIVASLFFDKETGLLRRVIRYGDSPIGRMPTQFDYSDYREVNGVKVPFHIEFLWLDGREGLQFSEVKANTTIDAIVFGRPTVLEKTLKK